MSAIAPAKTPGAEAGFVLPMVLVVIAIIGMSLWAAMSVLTGMNRDLTELIDDVRLETAAQRAEGRIGYMMMMEPLGSAGLRVNGVRTDAAAAFIGDEAQPIFIPGGSADKRKPAQAVMRFDGTRYRMPPSPDGGPNIIVQVQDEGGLFNISTVAETSVARYLEALGLKTEQARHLAATLADFIDDDDLHRLNGAEKDEYKRANQPPPANAPLHENGDLWRVLDWRGAFTPQQRLEVQETSSAALIPALSNINTAGPAALMAWFGLTREQADDVIVERQKHLLMAEDISRITGANHIDDEFRLYTSPSRRVRLRVSVEEGTKPADRFWQLWLTRGEASADRPYFRGPSGAIDDRQGRLAAFDRTQSSKKSSSNRTDGQVTDLPQSERLLPR